MAQATKLDSTALAVDRAESRFRLITGFLALFFVLANFLGVTWDIQWHNDVGPDSFWTLPHIFFYGGTAFAGLMCAFVVIRTTLRHHRGASGATDATTTPWLGLFRAPVGFVITGLGSLTFLISGLYDQWWHGLYGFDVTLVSPPHIGLLFAGLINAIGTVYMFASEGNRAAARGETGLLRPANIGFTMAMAVMLAEVSFFLVIGLGDISFVGPVMLYSLLVTILFTLGLVGAVSFLRTPGAATLVAVWFTLLRLPALYGATWATHLYAAALKLPYKEGNHGVAIVAMGMPALLILMGVLVDVFMTLGPRLGLRPQLAAPVAAVVAQLTNYLLDRRLEAVYHIFVTNDHLHNALAEVTQSFTPTLIAVIGTAVLMGFGAWNFGVTLRYTDK